MEGERKPWDEYTEDKYIEQVSRVYNKLRQRFSDAPDKCLLNVASAIMSQVAADRRQLRIDQRMKG